MFRIGFDVGGSKIAAIALDQRGRELARRRRNVPRDYPATLAALVELSEDLQEGRGPARAIGIGLSAIASLYAEVPKLWPPLTVAAAPQTRLAPARFGPESGLRGAAWLGQAA